MNLLDANDRTGHYPPSWYAATTPQLPPFPKAEGEIHADVCIIGGGYTGLSAALHLAEAGIKVVLIEAQRVGFGASGRNGGQLGSGQRPEQDKLEKALGRDAAHYLWKLAEDAKVVTTGLIEKHQIDCYLRPGVAWTGSSEGDVSHLHRYADKLSRDYGYDKIEPLDRGGCYALCPSPDYCGGILDRGAAHLHPLRYVLGLARAAQDAGVLIYEQSRATALHPGPRVETAEAAISADHVVLACNGYIGNLAPKVAARVLPINNFIIATEPLGDRTQEVLTEDVAVADSRFVVNYFRLSHDGRLLFGGGENYGYRFPADIASKVRKPMLQVFPHLRDVKVDYAWGGTLAITARRMPLFARLGPGVYSASGYSGHGVGTATHAGKLIAAAIQGDNSGFDAMAAMPTPRFPGGTALRSPLLALAMTWYAMRDRLGL
ncbi:gamma-glutamylputrescine oxidase [Poseidonocella pacifica]|uniref:Gamma-glutamylputrescine oxidase n=1 Tax=Poseidonocella pacifica TaxID=871651 RepID=A0A1I0X1W3_9RHOB|nr:FAD-binding oxidoreductase [Poseidonocella pacifica]SFA95002.1 gamma-glutamylputrescine oxidase [Poseidonocella pacifica]